MRVSLPAIKKSELFRFLKSNKTNLIEQKCKLPIKSDIFDYGCVEIKTNDLSKIGKSVKKTTSKDSTLSDDEVAVKVIGNMHGWCDSYMDVLIPGSADKTLKDRGASNKNLLYHLKNHNYSTDGIVGGDVAANTETISLDQFNIDSDLKEAEALMVSSIVRRKYDSKVYFLYLDDEIKQHSIGLRYRKIYLCINSSEEDYKSEKENYDKYIKYVINKDKVESRGFFWAVVEYQLLENSCVLFGANELTTVQEISKNIEPFAENTQDSEPFAENTLTEQLFSTNLI
jgi:hypothetical protein